MLSQKISRRYQHGSVRDCFYFSVALILLLCPSAALSQGRIDTIAGTLVRDGAPADQISLWDALSIAQGPDGSIYIYAYPASLLKLDSAGIITVVAGDGYEDFSGDDGPAIKARISTYGSVAVDRSGNLYLATNNRIRRIDGQTGIITTIAGTGVGGFSGDGGPATRARLSAAVFGGLLVDNSGKVIFSDGTHRVRQVDTRTGIITTLAGNGAGDFEGAFSGDGGLAVNASLAMPGGLALDNQGGLLIIDVNNYRVRRVDLRTGIIRTVAGNGTSGFTVDGASATQAAFSFFKGIAVEQNGSILIADNGLVRRITTGSGTLTTIAGTRDQSLLIRDNVAATASSLGATALALDFSGNLLIGDSKNFRLRWVDLSSGLISTWVGNGRCCFAGDGGPAALARLNRPTGAVTDDRGNVYIADGLNFRIRKVDGESGIISTVAFVPGPLYSLAIHPSGDLIVAAGETVWRVAPATGEQTIVAGTGVAGYGGDGGPASQSILNGAVDVAVDQIGNIYVADSRNNRIRCADVNGMMSTIAGDGASGYRGDGALATQASLSSPGGLAIGDEGTIYVADHLNQRVRRIDGRTGIITTVAGTGVSGLSGDGGAAISARLSPNRVSFNRGRLFISAGNRIRMIDLLTGTISTVVGNGPDNLYTFSGDGGSPSSANLNQPYGVSFDNSGNLLIVDTFNERVRRVSFGQ